MSVGSWPTTPIRRVRTRSSRAVIRRRRAAVHQHDRRRVVRALELAESGASLVPDATGSGRPTTADRRSSSGLDVATDELERRIRVRTEAMFDAGVVDEVRAALARQVSVTAVQALGLREIVTLSPTRGARATRRAHAAVCRLPAQVDAEDPGSRQGGRERAGARGGGCDSRSGTRSVTHTSSSSSPTQGCSTRSGCDGSATRRAASPPTACSRSPARTRPPPTS